MNNVKYITFRKQKLKSKDLYIRWKVYVDGKLDKRFFIEINRDFKQFKDSDNIRFHYYIVEQEIFDIAKSIYFDIAKSLYFEDIKNKLVQYYNSLN